MVVSKCVLNLGGGFKYFLCSPLFGEDSHFDSYFSKGLKPPTSKVLPLLGESFQFDEHFFQLGPMPSPSGLPVSLAMSCLGAL